MTQHIQEVAQRADRAATLAVTAALARRQVLLQRRHQEAVATAPGSYTNNRAHETTGKIGWRVMG
jgi:hypothetical protein